MSQIRPIAICLFSHVNKILVAEGYDPAKPEKFFRPIGGGIEFGEYAGDTIARETQEELNAVVRKVRYLFTLENIFVYNNAPRHEIVLVHDGALADETLYTRGVLDAQNGSGSFQAFWMSLDELRRDTRPLYPSGLLERLSRI